MKIQGQAILTFTNEAGEQRTTTIENIAPGIIRRMIQTVKAGGYSFNYSYNGVSSIGLALGSGDIGDSLNPVTPYLIADAYGARLSSSTPTFSKAIEDYERSWDTEWRFTSPGADRTIKSIFLCDQPYTPFPKQAKAYTYLKVDPPQIQGANENLDIKYRLVFSFEHDPVKANEYALFIYHAVTGGLENYMYASNKKMNPKLRYGSDDPLDISSYNFGGTSYIDLGILVDSWLSYIRDDNLDKLDHIGKLFRTFLGYKTGLNTLDKSKQQGKILEGDIQHPVLNHKRGNSDWAENVSFLASSQGQLVMSKKAAVNYSTPEEADMHVISITKEGAVGTARYDYRAVPLLGGFSGATLRRYGIINDSLTLPTDSTIAHSNEMPSIEMSSLKADSPYVTTHPKHQLWKGFSFNSQTYIRTGLKSLHIYHMMDNTVEVYDEGSAVQLPNVTLRKSVTRDNAGNIYVATQENKLVKLNVDKTFTVLDLPNTVGSLTALGHGANDRIWGANELGMHYSDDSGATWTSKGDWGDATNNANLSNANMGAYVYNIIADENIPDRLAIEVNYDSIEYRSYAYWYDGTANEIKATPGYSKNWSNMIYVVGSTWCYARASNNYGYIRWNSSDATNIAVGYYYDYRYGMLLGVDEFNNPIILLLRYTDASQGAGQTVISVDGSRIGDFEAQGVRDSEVQAYKPLTHRYDDLDGLNSPAFSFVMSDLTGTYAQMFGSVHNHSINTTWTEASTNHINGKDESINDCIMGDDYRYDSANNTWKKNWNKDGLDSQGNADLKRFNFKTDEHRFTGRSYAEIPSEALSDYSFLTTIVPEAKLRSAKTTNPKDNKFGHKQDFDRTILDIVDPASEKFVQLVWEDKDLNTVLIDGTDPDNIITTIIQVTAGNVEHRIGLTVTGTSAKVYINGVPTAVTLTNSMPLTADTKIALGAKYWNETIRSRYIHHFIRGSVTNAQLWNKVLTDAEMLTDEADHSGILQTTGCLHRYLLTEDLLEGKVTSTNDSELPFGMKAKFVEATTGTSFVKDDFFNTALIKDGFLKDNVASWSLSYSESGFNTVKVTDVYKVGAGVNTIPMRIGYYGYGTDYRGNNVALRNDYGVDHYTESYRPNAYGMHSFDSDAEYEFDITVLDGALVVGFASVADVVGRTSTKTFQVRISCRDVDTITIVSNGVTTQTDIPCVIQPGAKCKVTYTKATHEFKFYVMENAWVQYGTSVINNFADDLVTFTSTTTGSYPTGATVRFVSIRDAKLTFLHPDNLAYIGNPIAKTGFFQADSIHFDERWMKDSKIYLDGVEANVTVISSRSDSKERGVYSQGTPANAGDVILMAISGIIILHPDDTGKALSISEYDMGCTGAI